MTLYRYIYLFSAIFTDQQPVIQNVCKKQVKQVWSCFRKAHDKKTASQTKSQLSGYCALTVCGGHPLAIVGKSSQCHIKVWDYLRKYDNLELKKRYTANTHSTVSFGSNPGGKDYFCFLFLIYKRLTTLSYLSVN